jgi:ORF6N domain
MSAVTIPGIEKMIYVIRGQKVMLDSDLATLYEVETRTFNQAVKRNLDRFPDDFMFQITEEEYEALKNLSGSEVTYGGRRYLPMVFTECGVAMLSSILTSGRAAQVNISIMRTFIKLRSFLAMDSSLADRVGKLEKSTNQLFKAVFERLDDLEEGLPDHPKDRKRIGLKPNNN